MRRVAGFVTFFLRRCNEIEKRRKRGKQKTKKRHRGGKRETKKRQRRGKNKAKERPRRGTEEAKKVLGSVLVAPVVGKKEPGEHGVQESEPLRKWKSPGLQSMHVERPEISNNRKK